MKTLNVGAGGFFLFFASFILSQNASTENRSWLVKEEFLSPDIRQFDCHSSSIVEIEEGILYAVWKGGAGEGKSNIDMKTKVGVWSSKCDGGAWSEPKEIVTGSSVCWNPVLCSHPSGELLLFYRMGPNPRQTVSFVKRSLDKGISWLEAEILPAGITGPTKNKPFVTSKGTLVCPASVSVGEPEDPFKATACWMDISEDKGKHWKKVGPLELAHRKFGVIEPALFLDTAGRLRMLCRDRAYKMGERGFIWEAISEDEGCNWTELRQTDLPNPDSGFDVVDLGAGKLVLIYNHSHTRRFPLHMAISLDGGDHWSQPIVLDDIGEFPAGIVTKSGLIHFTYAFPSSQSDQRRIKHVVVDPEKLFSFF